MALRYRRKSIFVLLVGLSFVLFCYGTSVQGAETSEMDVRPYELLSFGHFDDIGLGENGFPEGEHRHIGLNKGDVYVDDKEAWSGIHSLYIEGIGGSQANGFGVDTAMTRPLEGGETYRFTVWYRAPEALATGQGSRIYARISSGSTNIHWDEAWFDPLPDGSQYYITPSRHLLYIRVRNSARQDPNDPQDWHPLTVTFTLPPGVDVKSVVNVYNDSTESLWIDDLSLQLL